MDESQLRHIWQNRQRFDRTAHLGDALEYLMKRQLAKRVKQVGQLAEVWDACIPEFIRARAALVSYTRGVVTVAVDSAPHRYQLQQLLSGGLLAAIRERFAGPINRIKVVPGSFEYLDMPDKADTA